MSDEEFRRIAQESYLSPGLIYKHLRYVHDTVTAEKAQLLVTCSSMIPEITARVRRETLEWAADHLRIQPFEGRFIQDQCVTWLRRAAEEEAKHDG